jgi:2-polyprenyl-3-methyl-5-hydroxy-6-metoxy-1,4-benzoquinol methylase
MDHEQLLAAMRAFQESRAILTAVELDLFTAIGIGADAAAIAGRVRANPRSTAMLLNALVACELVTKSGGVYRNTELSARHLAGEGRLASMHTVNMWKAWSTLTEAVRDGTAVHRPGVEAHDEGWTEAFIAAMHRNAAVRAPEVVRAVGTENVRRMLDVGGGSGAYSIAFAQANPDLEADILDLEPVTAIARRHIEAAGLADRVRTRAGDLRADSLGEGYDIVFVSAICHMLDEEENRDLLRRCFLACAPGGRVAIQDFILNADKTQPKWGALFALNMLVATRGGNSYSGDEYVDWLSAAGFANAHVVSLPGPTGLVMGTRQ